MAREDIFSKMSFGNYNNALESVLEKKAFSTDAKNLLLSMLYKIENAYQDYEIVKRNVPSRKEYVEKIIQMVEKDCKKIQFVKPYTQEAEALQGKNFCIEEENGEILVYQNEKMLLDALFSMKQTQHKLPEQYATIEPVLAEFLEQASIMNEVEVIRDFNGWSWDIVKKEMPNLSYHLIYQNLILLLGNYFMESMAKQKEIILEEQEGIQENPVNTILSNKNFDHIYDETKEQIDYIASMKSSFKIDYGEELAEKLLRTVIQLLIAVYAQNHEEEKQRFCQEQKTIEEQLVQMQDKRKYVESKSQEKKQFTKKIKELDTLLNDDVLLKQEYQERNRKLSNKHKIFSVSHLADQLEKERKQYLEEIKKINQSIEPNQFVQDKIELEEKQTFWQEIGVAEASTKQEELMEKWQQLFLQAMQKRIEQAETKKEIIAILYELRYYHFLPIKDGNIGNSKIAEKERIETQKKAIKKACEKKAINVISQEEETNFLVLKNIFLTKMITLEGMLLILRYQEGQLKIEIYDDTIHEKTVEETLSQKTELSVKLNKKIKIFI